MKKIVYFFVYIAASLFMVSCNQEKIDTTSYDKAKISEIEAKYGVKAVNLIQDKVYTDSEIEIIEKTLDSLVGAFDSICGKELPLNVVDIEGPAYTSGYEDDLPPNYETLYTVSTDLAITYMYSTLNYYVKWKRPYDCSVTSSITGVNFITYEQKNSSANLKGSKIEFSVMGTITFSVNIIVSDLNFTKNANATGSINTIDGKGTVTVTTEF